MSFEKELQKRSNGRCELCGSAEAGIAYAIPSSPGNKPAHHIWIRPTCDAQIKKLKPLMPITGVALMTASGAKNLQ